MKKIILYLFLPAYIFVNVSCMSSKTDSIRMAIEANKTKVSKDLKRDAKFAVCETDRGMLEARLSDLAQDKAASPNVKNFSRTMQQDQEKMNRELKALADKKNISVPDNLSEKSQKAYDYFVQKKGDRFDKAYMRCMQKAGKEQYRVYKKESKRGKDPEIKSWAASNIPAIEKKRKETKEACKNVKSEK